MSFLFQRLYVYDIVVRRADIHALGGTEAQR